MPRFKESEEDGEYWLSEIEDYHCRRPGPYGDLDIGQFITFHKFKTAEEREQYKLQHA